MPVLQFKGKSVVESYHHTVPHHRLEFDRELSLLPEGTDPGLDGNLIIEGDNLLALKALLPTHAGRVKCVYAGRVKCVYIDPPYNTGNEGWVYNDNLTQPQFKEWIGRTVGKEGEDTCRHDKWCCMMYPRLTLLWQLLGDDGSIWISVDDNEVHHLRCVLNEVFGEENFIATIIWQKMDSPKNTAMHLSEDHDYIVVYAKNADGWRPNPLPRSEEMLARYRNPDDDPRGPWLLSDLAARNYYADGRYPITTPNGTVIKGPPAGSYWRVSRKRFDELDADNRIWWGESGGNRPGIKRFLSEVREGVVPQTLWRWKDVGSTRHAKQQLSKIMAAGAGGDLFITPKPTRLIERVLTIATDPGDCVLDSFAGSGTTGQAVLSANANDGGDRKFVLVQMRFDNADNEADGVDICRTVTVPRIRRVIEGYDVNGDHVEGLGGSFTYATVGEPLFGEYRHFGDSYPAFETLAAYVFYTETSREADPAVFDPESGFIGSTPAAGGTSYYLLYTPDPNSSREMSRATLRRLAERDDNRHWVIYTEKVWLHHDQLKQFEREHGKRIRHMLVPFQLK